MTPSNTSKTPVCLVAVHGNGGGSTRFARLRDALAAESRLRLVAVDLPGFNGRPLPAHVDSVAAFADDLGEQIEAIRTGDDADATPLVVVLGHGIGGSIALDLAARRPGLVDGLILHAPVGADLDTRWFPKLMSTRPVRELIRRGIAARGLRPVWRRLFFPIGAPRDDLDTFFEGYRDCAAFGTMFEVIDAEWFESVTPVDDVPVIVLWGEHDRVLRSGQADAIGAKVPGARRVVQPGWDHFPMIEQPEEYADVIGRLALELAAPPD